MIYNNAKKIIGVILIFIFLFSFISCKKTENGETTSEPESSTLPVSAQESTSETETEPESETETQTGTEDESETQPEFEFDFDEADFLDSFNSRLYGKVRLFYQEHRLVFIDSYDEQICVADARGYEPEGTSDEDDEFVFEDLNFDGYTDLRISHASGALNKYCYCWLWDMHEKNFEYFKPLDAIPNPTFDQNGRRVISYNRLNYRNAIITEYVWQGNELLPVSHREVDNGNDYFVDGPEDVDTPVSIFDGMVYSGVMLSGNANSQSRWLCKIEDESIVGLYSEDYNNVNNMYSFMFQGKKEGTTTVVLRYATSWDADYIAYRAFNITVKPDMTLRIIETD